MRALPLVLLVAGCAPWPIPDAGVDAGRDDRWRVVFDGLDAALLSVWGRAHDDVWIVGADADDGLGPVVLHWDGVQFRRRATGASGALWWVRGTDDGRVFFCGDAGLVLRYDEGDDAFTTLPAPSGGDLFGIMPFAVDDAWVVGPGDVATWDGATWTRPPALTDDHVAGLQPYKVWGPSSDDVWIVAAGDSLLRARDGAIVREPLPRPFGLFTVHGADDLVVGVGGDIEGVVIEARGDGALVDASVLGMPQLNGVHVVDGERALASGAEGAIWRRDADGWRADDGAPTTFTTNHAAWVDERGGEWVVGGNLGGRPLIGGTVYTRGVDVDEGAPFPTSAD